MKNLVLTTCLVCLSVFVGQAQETSQTKDNNQNNENLYVKIKDGSNPDVYIDGKKYDFTILDLLDQNKIESISILKDEQAIKEYNAPNGVLVIKSKKDAGSNIIYIKNLSQENKDVPKVIIDGKISDQETLSKISPEDIHSINIIKGKEAEKKHDAPYGVIIVTTKKEN